MLPTVKSDKKSRTDPAKYKKLPKTFLAPFCLLSPYFIAPKKSIKVARIKKELSITLGQ
jgi:hypothetical protein